VVNTTDGVLILNNTTPAHAYQAAYDFNGDGVVSSTDFTLYRPFIGTVLPSLPPQLAAGGEGSGNVPLLTSDELAPVLAEAVYDWAAAGLRETEVARLEHVSAQIVALPAGYLGGAAIGGDSIYLSADAAGNGWFVDPTPRTIAAVAATMASAPAIPADREDLLTVVLHELGHVLGLGDLDPTVTPDDLMTETLPSGVRRLPSDRDVIAAIELGSVDPVQSQVNGAGLLFAATGDPLHESRNLVAWTDEVANASISRNADKEAAKRRSNTAIDELFSILAES
jgi:hypothetical protein